VCDGFVGNVALKTSEGVARLVSHFMRQGFQRNMFTRCAGLLARPVLNDFKNKIDPRLYNGASLLGLQGIVIKSHGRADAFAFEQAISIARLEAQKQIPQRIDEQLHHYLSNVSI
jgi:glycerol-3-phosphate acyltransferase PlsX